MAEQEKLTEQDKLSLSGKSIGELREPDKGYCLKYGRVAVQYGDFPKAPLLDVVDQELLMRGPKAVEGDTWQIRDERFRGLLEAAGVENPNLSPETED